MSTIIIERDEYFDGQIVSYDGISGKYGAYFNSFRWRGGFHWSQWQRCHFFTDTAFVLYSYLATRSRANDIIMRIVLLYPTSIIHWSSHVHLLHGKDCNIIVGWSLTFSISPLLAPSYIFKICQHTAVHWSSIISFIAGSSNCGLARFHHGWRLGYTTNHEWKRYKYCMYGCQNLLLW